MQLLPFEARENNQYNQENKNRNDHRKSVKVHFKENQGHYINGNASYDFLFSTDLSYNLQFLMFYIVHFLHIQFFFLVAFTQKHCNQLSGFVHAKKKTHTHIFFSRNQTKS